MKRQTRAEIEAILSERKERLAELETHGTDALSKWDKYLSTVGYGGEEGMLELSKRLLRNQIRFWEEELAEIGGGQLDLF